MPTGGKRTVSRAVDPEGNKIKTVNRGTASKTTVRYADPASSGAKKEVSKTRVIGKMGKGGTMKSAPKKKK